MKLAGIFGIFVGTLMVAQWSFYIVAGQVPELVTEPVRISFHLAAELVTALGLIVSGIGLLRGSRRSHSLYLFFAGMLTYSVIVSPGYFAQQGQWLGVLMFAALLLLALTTSITVERRTVQGGAHVEP
jgi:hypothetical protein